MSGCETNFPRDCPMCGSGKHVGASKVYAWHVTCANCYDGAPDAGRQLHGCDVYSRSAAINDWNEQVAEYEADRDDCLRDLENDRKIDIAKGK